MAEIVYKSPGVFTREVDSSQPSQTSQALSTPAGVIGTANLGPAYIPVIVNSLTELTSVFGGITGDSFGKLAAAEYFKNGGGSIAYVRVLGAGDGKARNANGTVTNAGYFVGNENIQSGGNVGKNIYANTNAGAGETLGRSYFLGCFMSESNGSTIFSDAGLQSTTQTAASFTATAAAGLVINDDTDAGNLDTQTITFTLPTIGNIVITIIDSTGTPSASGANIQVKNTDDSETLVDKLVKAINGETDANIDFGDHTGIPGVTATKNSISDPQFGINLLYQSPGTIGNNVSFQSNSVLALGSGESVNTAISLAGGVGGSIPILRGVLLAPSGVALSLSSSFNNNLSQHPVLTTTATTDGSTPRYGQMTGSIELAGSGTFVLILNGFKGSTERPSNVITASFESNSDFYFGKEGVFNIDPLKIEEHGHYLYSHYYLHPQYATITGSGNIPAGFNTTYENTAFILTSSISRGATSGFGNTPDYEDWQDRFSYAESPYIVSQDGQDLFKLVSRSPGKEFSTSYKFSISSINPTEKTFSLGIRHADDIDGDIGYAEPLYTNISLDPNSRSYISRIIGDINTKFDFDNDNNSQKITIEGSHYGKSKLVRVVASSDLENGNIDSNAVPFGFRGPMHTVTSGTMMASYAGNYGNSDVLKRLIEPPIPYREHLNEGAGTSKAAFTKYYWGYQSEAKTEVTLPNQFNNSVINSNTAYLKHYPTHRTDTTNFAVKENTGAADVNGSILDVDLFNKSLFSLSNIKVRTGSNEKADPAQWSSASYVRGGGITEVAANKTRALAVNDLAFSNNSEYVKFTCLFQGGFDGVDKFNKDKSEFLNDAVKREYDNVADQGGVKSGPTIKAYRKALDILGSKSDVDIQLLANPGIRHSSVTDYGISVAENRFDTLYIMDIEQRDSLDNVITGSTTELNKPSIRYTTSGFVGRSLNTSFAAAYFPDVNISFRNVSRQDELKQVPPTVAVLGAYANNDTIGESWFAPAGNTRGVLSSAITTELGTINRTNLDTLYSADINPINDVVNVGITIQGQKTLLKNLSALDRVNVRRLLITVRRAVRNIANTLIFEPNRPETLNKFRSMVNPILESLKSQQGVARYKVVIDETTTTQADVENNTLRGKIYLQPVRVAEFIALDFNITNNGIID